MFNQKPLPGDLLDYGNSLNDGLVGFWPFNEDNNSNKVFDLSGNGNDGTFAGTAPSWTVGKFGSAVNFPATDEYVDCGNKSILNLQTALTLVVRLKWDLLPATGVKQALVKSGGYFWIGSFDVNPRFLVFTGGNDTLTGSTTLNTTDFFHIAGTWSTADNTMRLYVNGVPDGTLGTAGNINDNAAAILKIGGDAATLFDGLIDHVMIYNRVLSASEIALLCREPFRMVRTRRRRIITEEIAGVPPTTFPYYYREIASRRIA